MELQLTVLASPTVHSVASTSHFLDSTFHTSWHVCQPSRALREVHLCCTDTNRCLCDMCDGRSMEKAEGGQGTGARLRLILLAARNGTQERRAAHQSQMRLFVAVWPRLARWKNAAIAKPKRSGAEGLVATPLWLRAGPRPSPLLARSLHPEQEMLAFDHRSRDISGMLC